MDISRQLTEYQVEYNVLQEEITSQNYHLENLKKAKEENSQLAQQLVNAQNQIQEFERSRLTQQKQMQVFQSQIQSLEVTIDVLGHFILDLADTRHDIEYPGEILQIIQQLSQVDQRKKPKNFEKKLIYKSKSVNSNLGFPLRVLEELNEGIEKDSILAPAKESSIKFFDRTYEKSRQKNNLINFDESEEDLKIPPPKKIDLVNEEENVKDGIPPRYENILLSPTEEEYKGEMHPLSTIGDVNFRFDGTTQLKTLRAVHTRSSASPLRTETTDYDTTGRS